jgi:hypothetical protein
MTRRGVAIIIGAVLTLGAAAPVAALDASEIRLRLKQCHEIGATAERVRCYDALAEADAASQPQASAPSEVGPSQTAQAIPSPAPEPVPKRDLTEVLFASDAGKATLTATSIGETPKGLLRIATEEGIVLDQAEPERLFGRPRPGDKIIVTRSFIGGHWCRTSTRDMFRCTATRVQASAQ